MSSDSVIAYWIEADTCEVLSKVLGPNDIFRSGSYDSEVHTKHARDAVEVCIIPLAQAGNDWAVSALERLKKQAAELRLSKES